MIYGMLIRTSRLLTTIGNYRIKCLPENEFVSHNPKLLYSQQSKTNSGNSSRTNTRINRNCFGSRDPVTRWFHHQAWSHKRGYKRHWRYSYYYNRVRIVLCGGLAYTKSAEKRFSGSRALGRAAITYIVRITITLYPIGRPVFNVFWFPWKFHVLKVMVAVWHEI